MSDKGSVGAARGKSKPKTVTVRLFNIKEPDRFGGLAADLKLHADIREQFFECSEYASVELEVDDSLNIIGGRFLPRSEW